MPKARVRQERRRRVESQRQAAEPAQELAIDWTGVDMTTLLQMAEDTGIAGAGQVGRDELITLIEEQHDGL